MFVNNNIFKVRAVRNIKTASSKLFFYMKFRNALLIIIVLLAGALFATGLVSPIAFQAYVHRICAWGRKT